MMIMVPTADLLNDDVSLRISNLFFLSDQESTTFVPKITVIKCYILDRMSVGSADELDFSLPSE